MLEPLLVGGRPHWETRFPAEVWPAFEDFRNYLTLVWEHLGLPPPTDGQYEIAHRLQYGVDSVEWETLDDSQRQVLLENPRTDIIRAFRGIGKSYITSAFVVWRLMRNPRDEKVLVLSATGAKAKEFVDQTKGVLESMPLVQWLLQGPRERGGRRRDMSDKFDVAAASLSQSFSVKAVGIDGQITGSRATLLVPDDIEIPKNSKTEDARKRILDTIRSDFGPITKTEHGRGDIIFLGTPQTEESIYNILVVEMGYSCFTIPVRYPRADKLKGYTLVRAESKERVDILAFYLRQRHENGELDEWSPTDTRFTNEELLKEEGKGRAHFALQMMLDTSLSDAERYPLRQHDLVIMSLNAIKAPITVQWGRHNDRRNVLNIPNLGFSGDFHLGPLFVDTEWRPYEGKVLWVDPAGRGKDETSWSILAHLSGMLYLLHIGALRGDPVAAMRQIAIDAKRFEVNVIEVEPNYGQGMWVAGFQPILMQIWNDPRHKFLTPETAKLNARKAHEDKMGGCTIQESEWARGQKETRIIDTLEPVLTAHRLVVDEELVRAQAAEDEREYSALYQLTHITRERKSLSHEDRLESLAGAVAHFQRAVSIDSDEAAKAILDQEKQDMIDDFIEMFKESPLGLRSRVRGKQRADGTRSEVTQFKV